MVITRTVICDDFKKYFRTSGINRPQLCGSFVEGVIVAKNKNIAVLHTGLKTNALFLDKEVHPFVKKDKNTTLTGRKLQLHIQNIENSEGEHQLNPYFYGNKLKAVTAWERVQKLKYARGVILNTVNGGFSVGIGGVVAFLPRSRAKLPKVGKRAHIQYLMEHYCMYKIIKVNHLRRNIVVSLTQVSTHS